MSKMFHKVVVKERVQKPMSRKKAAFKATVHTLLIAITLFVIFQLLVIGFKVYQNFSAIKFAYEKPAIVNTIKKDFEVKQLKLEQSYFNASQSAQQELIDAVVAKLKEDNLK